MHACILSRGYLPRPWQVPSVTFRDEIEFSRKKLQIFVAVEAFQWIGVEFYCLHANCALLRCFPDFRWQIRCARLCCMYPTLRLSAVCEGRVTPGTA